MSQSKSIRRNADQWQEIIIKQKDSNRTVKDYCREQELCLQSFYKWKRKFLKKNESLAPRFIQVSQDSVDESCVIRVKSSQGLQVEIILPVNENIVRDVLVCALKEEQP